MTPDVVIVGAGPAGVSAALWARSLDLVPEVLESAAETGGQLELIHFHPFDLAGVTGGGGAALAAALARQLRDAGIEVRHGAAVVALEDGLDERPPCLVTAAGTRHPGGAVLIASGVRRRRLDVPGERELEGRGVSTSATRDRSEFAGRPMVVVGGGDAAFENALLLSEVGCPVTLVVRDHRRARPEFVGRVARDPRIEVLADARVTAILGRERVTGVEITSGGRTFERPAAGVVIKVGVIPNTEWCAGVLDLDPEGYLRVDAGLRTSRPRVWAAGDVTHPIVSGIAVAIGQGALAMGSIRSVLRPA